MTRKVEAERPAAPPTWRLRMWSVLLPMALAGGCRCEGPERRQSPPVKEAASASFNGAPSTGAARHALRPLLPAEPLQRLVLVGHHDGAHEARFAIVPYPPDPSGEPLQISRTVVAPVLPWRRLADRYQVVAAYGAGRLAVATAVEGMTEPKEQWATQRRARNQSAYSYQWLEQREAARRFRAQVWSLDQQTPPLTVDIGAERPAALHIHQPALLIGVRRKLLRAPLDAVAGAGVGPEVVHRGSEDKPYDLFARHGDQLVAVDDLMQPYLADLFRLLPEGRIEHLAAWKLPGVVNGGYERALLLRRGEQHASLLLHYGGVSHGNFYDGVWLLPIGGQILQRAAQPLLQERADKPPLAGAPYSPWRGVAVLSDGRGDERLAVAAQDRGVMLVQLKPAAEGRARAEAPRLVDMGGSCLDILAQGQTLFALVAGGGEDAGACSPKEAAQGTPAAAGCRHRLVELRLQGGSLRPQRTLTLPEPYQRFVQ